MPKLQRSAVTLRLMGDDLIPGEITKLLGASPTHAVAKGDKIVGKKTGHVRIATTGMWLFEGSGREPEDMNAQIHEILGQTTEDLDVWQSITRRYSADLFCGLFMRFGNEGVTISAQSLAALGARGIEMSLDIYAGNDKEVETST